jgi:hypothetical protein
VSHLPFLWGRFWCGGDQRTVCLNGGLNGVLPIYKCRKETPVAAQTPFFIKGGVSLRL